MKVLLMKIICSIKKKESIKGVYRPVFHCIRSRSRYLRAWCRFVCAPAKLRFFVSPMNLVDFVTLIPFYISILLEELEDFEIIGKAGKILRLMKV